VDQDKNPTIVTNYVDQEQSALGAQMAKKHSPGFEKICEDARTRIREVSAKDVRAGMISKQDFTLIDVREDHEWSDGRIPGAMHLGKGIIERDIENTIPDTSKKIILYCGGGYRSALAADALQRIGYNNVFSMAGGFSGWKDSNFPITRE
jgi:rhodanese-related sulfurtransferase